ncbi:MAG: HAMP domain-containing histidine kinase [Gammaproteobacteria bacterium]|nr:HAMP domain-containing histidine kinase [Gammaproteobacteria bacterium]
MTLIPRSLGISRQILMIILLIIVFVMAGLSIVTGVSSFNNLATITLDELGRMSKILSVQLQELQKNAEKSVTDMEANPQLSDRLEQLTNLGPYYLDSSQQGHEIDESDKIYALQSQLDIIQALQPLKNLHQLSSISLYNLSPFNLVENAQPVLNLRMDNAGTWVAKFIKKGSAENRAYYRVDSQYQQVPPADLFDVSSIYQLAIEDFYLRLNFKSQPTTGFEEILNNLPANNDGTDRVFSRLVLAEDIPVIQTWGYLKVPISNPDTWEVERVPAMIVVLEQAINDDKLKAIKRQLGIDVALARSGNVLISSLAGEDILEPLQSDQTVTSSTQGYYYAQQKLMLHPKVGEDFGAVVLSPISTLEKLTQSVLLQMSLLALGAFLCVIIAIYWAINRLVKQPLNRLMAGVENVSQGDLSHPVKIESKNELGQLASAFNNMSAEICRKNKLLQNNADSLLVSNAELKRYQTTLEEMVDQRTDKLKQAQKQLIESEKMASLGELVAGVAHEINTPVGVGVTAASYLSDEAQKIDKKYKSEVMTREDFQEFLDCSLQTTKMILSNLQRATELVKSFKQVAVDQTAEDRRLFSVKSYIEEVLITLQPRLKKTPHQIVVSGDSSIEIDSYPGSFSQIITNLIMNSVIHAYDENDAGHISIVVSRRDENICLVYTDDGKGVDRDSLAKIFDPFYTTKRGFGGTGLGMHIVYNLITQKLKGTIICESQVGQGVSLTITVPATADGVMYQPE